LQDLARKGGRDIWIHGNWKLPILFVCENNCWAGAQSLSEHCAAGDIAARAVGYGMPGELVDGNDVAKVYTLAKKMVMGCRLRKYFINQVQKWS
jgi:TPP-dependent pyruvate/acetoin dehydrogenase alpha subunit